MAGLFVIILAILISVLGANVRPDSSVDANNQIQQIARLNPGTKVKHLKVRKNREIEAGSFFGKRGDYRKNYEKTMRKYGM